MIDIMAYTGKRVLVTGCASGMGQETARLLLDLGAEVHGLDYQPAALELASFHRIDLRDPVSIRDTAAAIEGSFDALFNCAGVGPTFSPLDIVKVNFLGTRMLTEQVLSRLGAGSAIGSIASTAGMAWSRRIPLHKEFIAEKSFEAGVGWAEAHSAEVDEGYSFSKEAVIVWTMLQSQQLIRRGIRINCILPALTQTPMLTDQIAVKSDAAMLERVVQPMGRPSTPQEQAFMLLAVNSPRASFLNGAAINVDGGRLAGLTVG